MSTAVGLELLQMPPRKAAKTAHTANTTLTLIEKMAAILFKIVQSNMDTRGMSYEEMTKNVEISKSDIRKGLEEYNKNPDLKHVIDTIVRRILTSQHPLSRIKDLVLNKPVLRPFPQHLIQSDH